MTNKSISSVVFALLFMISCVNRETKVDKSKLLGGDYRLFQDTPAWALAKATQDEDVSEIKSIVSRNENLLHFVDPKFGQTLLQFALLTQKYPSFKTLLALGADANAKNSYNGESALMEAARIRTSFGKGDSRYLEALLQHGGNPNLVQDTLHSSIENTPLLIACQNGVPDYVKILLRSGANINYRTSYGGNALYNAVISRNPDVVIYLLDHGADYTKPMFTDGTGKKRYIAWTLRSWLFDLQSEKYKKKMQIVDFLQKYGMDYWKEPIPRYLYNVYDKGYLNKY